MSHFESELIAPEGSSEDEGTESQSGKIKSVLREVVETLLLAVVIWGAVNITTARFVVEGDSMEPNLHTGEFVIVSRAAYWNVFGEPERGDVVVLHPPTNPEQEYIKRVIGLPGDTVEVREGQVFVNNEMLNESYVVAQTPQAGTWVVGEDEYFVLGDNRTNSDDSRKWGQNQLSTDLIVGKAWLIYWPPREWGLVSHVDAGVTPAQASGVGVPTATHVPPEVPIEGGPVGETSAE